MIKSQLDKMLLANVVTLQYQKQNGQRRTMVCTKCPELLLSFEGKSILGFWQPKNSPRYNIDATNNLLVWDIEKRDYRTVECSRAIVKNSIPGEKYRELVMMSKLKQI